jgi:O-antigen/teichoic acid export membrane protein
MPPHYPDKDYFMAAESKRQSSRPLVEKAGWAVFWNAAFFPIKILVPFVSSVIVVRSLRGEGFAILSLATALLTFLGLFADLGIERTLPRFYPEIEMRYGRRGTIRLLFMVALIKGAVLFLLIGALALFPDYWITTFNLGESGGLLLLFIAMLLVLGAASDVSVQFLYAHFRQKITNSLDVLAAVVYPTLTAFLVLAGWSVLGAILALLITTILSVGLALWQVLRLLRDMPQEPHHKASEVRIPSNRPLRQRLVSFAGLNYLINWTVYLYDLPFVVLAVSLLVVAPQNKTLEVAVVALAYKFTKQFLRALVVPLTGVQTPLFARLYAEGRIEGLNTAYSTITKFLLLALLPSGVGLVLIARNVLQVLYGQIGLDAVVTQLTMPSIIACTAILAFGLFGEAIISVALNVLMVYEDYRAVITARLVALVSIPLMLLLVPQYGAIGAALAAASAGLASRGVALGYAVARLGLRFPGRFFVRVGTASLLMGLALLPFLAFLPPNIPSTALMLLTGVTVFYAAFKLLGGMDTEDKNRFAALRIPFAQSLLRFL